MQPVVSISVIRPRPGQFDTFLTLQLAQHARLAGRVDGLCGSRLYRATDGASLVLISVFETREHQEAFGRSDAFKDHFAQVRPLIEPGSPGLFHTAFAAGQI